MTYPILSANHHYQKFLSPSKESVIGAQLERVSQKAPDWCQIAGQRNSEQESNLP